MKTIHRIFATTLSIFFTAAAHASLQWEQTAVELHPSINDKQAIGHFKYQNTGKSPIHFKDVHASCGCTTARTQQDIVNPGDKGEITATFNIGDRVGTQVKTISVQTDDPDPVKGSAQLKLTAIIPQALEVNPTFVFWGEKEEAKPKTVIVKVAKELTVKDLKVTPSSQDFETKVEKAGKDEFKIEVKPKETSRMLAGTLTIQPDSNSKLSYVNMRVMGPQVPASAPASMATGPGKAQPGAGQLSEPNPAGQAGTSPAPAASSTPRSNH